MNRWLIPPPQPRDTFVEPNAELPAFLARRLQAPKMPAHKLTYVHPYVRLLTDMVIWAMDEYQAGLVHYAAQGNRAVVAKIQRYTPAHVLVAHPAFAEMVDQITPDMWDMLPKRVRRLLTDAYEIAQQRGTVRAGIGIDAALLALSQAEPDVSQIGVERRSRRRRRITNEGSDNSLGGSLIDAGFASYGPM